MSEILVFVYGTLKRGMSNHRWLRGQRFVDESRTLPSYRMYDLGGYPGLVPYALSSLICQVIAAVGSRGVRI